MKSGSINMTTGKPLRIIIAFAIPIMLSGVVQQFYNIADTYIVGKYISDNALAAIGAVGPMNSLLIGLAMGVTSGFSIPVAQSFGAQNRKMTNHYAGNAISLTIIISLIMTVIAFVLMKPVLRLMGTPENIFKDAYTYVSIIYSGVTINTLYNVLASILRATGDSKAPLKFLSVCAVVNVILNYITIVPLSMGVAGAAVSTVLAQLASCIMCIIYIKNRKDLLHIAVQDLRIKKSTTVTMLKMGIPMALQFSITAIGSVVLQRTINSYGSNYVAGWTVANKPELLANIPLSATGVACATFAGQNFGAGKMDRVRKGIRSAILFSGSLSVLMSVTLFFLGEKIARIFLNNDNTEAISASQTYLRVIAIFYLALAVLFVFRSALQGIGKTYVSMMAGVAELVGRIIAALILSRFFGFTGLCFAPPFAWILADVPLLVIYFVKVVKKYPLRKKVGQDI